MSKRWLLITRSVTLLSLMLILAPLLISDVLEFQNYYGHLVRNTTDELDVISTTLQQKRGGSVIVVTNKAHTRRVHELWNRFDSDRGKIIVHGLANDDFQPSAWWTRTTDTHQVIHEILGMINVWAGLPMQSVLHPREAVAQNELQQAPKLVPVIAQRSPSDSDD